MSTTNWMPTRKWMATQSTALATLAVSWVNAGTWNKPLSIAAIGVVSQAVVSYLIPNVDHGQGAGLDGRWPRAATSASQVARAEPARRGARIVGRHPPFCSRVHKLLQ